MKCSRLLVAIFFLLIGSSPFAQPVEQLLDQVAQRLTVGSGLQGRFLQEKHLAFLQQPFISSGEFSLDRSEGLRWQVLEPLKSLMLIDGSRVLLDGQRMDDHGIGQLIELIMLGLMEGQLDGLSRYFDIAGKISSTSWQLSLQPRSSRLKYLLQHIELRGEDHLQEIEIFEQGDNRTVIIFKAVHHHNAGDPGFNASPPQ